MHIQLREEAQPAAEALEHYLTELAAFEIEKRRWDAEDTLASRLQELIAAFYQQMGRSPASPEHLTIVSYHPGMIRLEPFFGNKIKAAAEPLKAGYLARGRDEMRAFTEYLKGYWGKLKHRDALLAGM